MFERHSRGSQPPVPQPESHLPGGALPWPAQPCLLPRAGRPEQAPLMLPVWLRHILAFQSLRRDAGLPGKSLLLYPTPYILKVLYLPLEIISSATVLNLLFVKPFTSKTRISLDKRSVHKKSSFTIICLYKSMPVFFP